eukprot:1158142-Pelagomonas_calceolata.AAC.2
MAATTEVWNRKDSLSALQAQVAGAEVLERSLSAASLCSLNESCDKALSGACLCAPLCVELCAELKSFNRMHLKVVEMLGTRLHIHPGGVNGFAASMSISSSQ